MFLEFQYGVSLIVFFVLLAAKVWALLDAILRPAQAYEAADKMTKTGWLWILGLTLAAHILLSGSLFLGLLGAVAALVYLLDVRPALVAVTRRR